MELITQLREQFHQQYMTTGKYPKTHRVSVEQFEQLEDDLRKWMLIYEGHTVLWGTENFGLLLYGVEILPEEPTNGPSTEV